MATDFTDAQGRSSSLDDGSSALLDSSDDTDLSDDDLDDDEDIEVDVDGVGDEVDVEVDVDGDEENNVVISELIDIQEPLSTLKKSLEKRLGQSLKNHKFLLQGEQKLPDSTSLVDQCVQGKGLVQIDVKLSGNEINIVDVLKPSDEVIRQNQAKQRRNKWPSSSSSAASPPKKSKKESKLQGKPVSKPESSVSANASAPVEPVTKWVVSKEFRAEQEQMNFPKDPLKWETLHVAHWINWVQAEFPNASIDPEDWVHLNGQEVCSMTQDEFRAKVRVDPGDLVWTHLELLRKCKFVAVLQDTSGNNRRSGAGGGGGGGGVPKISIKEPRKTVPSKEKITLGSARYSVMSDSPSAGRIGNNGQVQLWQFLLELLTDKEHRSVIRWEGDEGEFKLHEPEEVARLWGERKGKTSMNYEKLSRALRYYYEGEMISKVSGKRFMYKFVCNLKELIGYNAKELNALTLEAEQKASGAFSVYR